MAKSSNAKTNGHTVAALKPAAPKKPAAKAPAKRAAVKPAAKAAAGKPVARPAVKSAPKPPAKVATKVATKVANKVATKAAPKVAVKAAPKVATKVASKVATKAPAKQPAVKSAPKPASQTNGSVAPAAVDAAKDKVRKAKLVRDSFTMPEQEYAVLGQVKKACLKAGFEIKKSELLRIGVALISQLDLATLQKVLGSLPQLKTGRPKND